MSQKVNAGHAGYSHIEDQAIPPMRIGDTLRSYAASATDPYICRGPAARDYTPRRHFRRRLSTSSPALNRRLDHVGCPQVVDGPENLPKERRRQGVPGGQSPAGRRPQYGPGDDAERRIEDLLTRCCGRSSHAPLVPPSEGFPAPHQLAHQVRVFAVPLK